MDADKKNWNHRGTEDTDKYIKQSQTDKESENEQLN